MADDREWRAPLVISDAGAVNTFGRLLPKEAVPRPGIREVVTKASPSVAHLCLYVGLKHTAEELGLNGTNLWIYPDADHDANFARFFASRSALPTVYISFPSAKDPSSKIAFPVGQPSR
jgi:all-trans-retinol 13,14-reductase